MQTASVEPRPPGEEGEDCIGDDELLRFVGGAVDDARASIIRAHVDACDDCRELLAIAGREAAAADPETARNRAAADAPSPRSAADDRSVIDVGTEVDGRFRIEREIGRGGMGVVYAARHLSMHREVAFKVLSEEIAADHECVTRFLRETRVAAKLISPHAVRVFDVGRLRSGAPYMVMELLEGQDLEQALAAEGTVFAVPRALDIIAQACDAIGEAHLAGIVHRDIKLANLFLATATPTPMVKVLDFGLAKGGAAIGAESSLTHAEALMGTPHYMPPEQLASSKDVDARADVWSLGVALYRLLTRKYPYNGAHFAALAARILAGSAQPPSAHRPDLPPAVDRLVMKCMQRDPKDRYGDANELAEAISHALGPAEPITHVAIGGPAVAAAEPVTKPDPAPIAAPAVAEPITKPTALPEPVTKPNPAAFVAPDTTAVLAAEAAAARAALNGTEDTVTFPAFPTQTAHVEPPRLAPQTPMNPLGPMPQRISTLPLHPRQSAVSTARTARPAERPTWPYAVIVTVIGIGIGGAVMRRPHAVAPDDASQASASAEPATSSAEAVPVAVAAPTAREPSAAATTPARSASESASSASPPASESAAASVAPPASAPQEVPTVGRAGAHGPRRGGKAAATAPRTTTGGAPTASPPASAEKHYEKM